MTPAHAEAPATFAFTGSGYGHGVGMSQIGAKARALAGESATAILNYYYKDVVVTPVVDTQTIRVNLGHLQKSATFTAIGTGAQLNLYAGDIGAATDIAPTATFQANQPITFSMDGAKLMNGPARGKSFTIRWTGMKSLISYSKNGASTKYRYGQIQLKVVSGAIEVTNSLALHDEYLLGVSELSSAWPAAVLEAQVIASRSYALAKMATIKPSCDCHVYDHIVDQNFVGYSKESEAKVGKFWKAAVSRTLVDTSTGLAMLSKGKPIQAYFFSSSGGATQTTLDAWGQPSSYTQSVPDTASLDVKLNPRFAQWKASVNQDLLAKAFLLSDIVTLEIISRNTAGAVTYIKGTSSEGSTKLLRGDTFRSRVKLPSPYFNFA
jgi:SpoIID/LytB domain protein